MTDSREPPPLFDEDESSRKDDDIFASAVQSPMSDEVMQPAAVQVVASSHPLLEPSAEEEEVSEGRAGGSAPVNAITETKSEQRDIFDRGEDEALNDTLKSVSLCSQEKPIDQVSSAVGEDGGGGGDYSFLSGSSLTNSGTNSITPVHDLLETDLQTSNTSLSEDKGKPFHTNSSQFLSDFDTTEILLDDNALAQEISLKDDDDDDLFQSVATTMHHPIQDSSSAVTSTCAQSVMPAVGAPLHQPPLPVVTATYSASAASVSPSPMSPVSVPSVSPSAEQIEKDSGDTFISITVSDPQKIGDGIGSYMSYKVTTNTDIPYFRKKNWSVTRRFSDFLGLHSKLVEKHLHAGVIIPPAPEKAAIATTKIKLGSDKSSDFASVEFIERRRAALERYMNRTSAHPKLRADPDFREFIELDTELPRATQTSAISSAGVLRLFNKMGETVNKMSFKMDESDQWFEEKTQHIESLDNQLRKLHSAMEGLVGYRRELANSTGSFSNSAAILSSVEEHSALSRALHQLAEATDRVHTIHHAQADADFYHLSETTKDYINLIGAVKEVFHERVKTYQTWQHAEVTLAKKRENKAKTELTGRIDKVEQASEEVREWEAKVDRSRDEFQRISQAIKVEMEQFDVIRIIDFKDTLIKYLEALITSQLQIVKVWESFLPEAKAIA